MRRREKLREGAEVQEARAIAQAPGSRALVRFRPAAPLPRDAVEAGSGLPIPGAAPRAGQGPLWIPRTGHS